MNKQVTDHKKGIMLAIAAAFFYSVISLCVKWIGGGLPTMEMVFFRAFVMLCMGTGTMIVQGKKLAKHDRPLLIFRGISGTFGAFTYYAAIKMIPMAETSALCNLSPFIVSILAWLFLKEKITKRHIVALIISFAGALCIIRPDFGTIKPGYLVAIASAIITGTSYTAVRALKKKVDTDTIVFYYNLMSCLISGPIMIAQGFVMPTPVQFLKLIALGASALIFNFLNTASYKYAPAGKISIYTYMSIIFSSMFGIILWKEYLVTGTIIGIALILCGAYYSYRAAQKESSEA